MFHHQWAYLDYKLYRAGYPGHMHAHWQIEGWDEEHVNTHIQEADCKFGNFELPHCHRVVWVAFWAERLWFFMSAVCVGRAEVHLFFVPPICLQICCSAIVATKASLWVGLTKHRWMRFYHSLHRVMARRLKSPLLHFSGFGLTFCDLLLPLLYWGARTPSFGHFGYLQGQAHVGLFQLHPTSFSCHSSRYVVKLQEICCCL